MYVFLIFRVCRVLRHNCPFSDEASRCFVPSVLYSSFVLRVRWYHLMVSFLCIQVRTEPKEKLTHTHYIR